MARFSVLAVALFFGIGSLSEAGVGGSTFTITTVSLSSQATGTGSMGFTSSGSFSFTPTSGTKQNGFFVETDDATTGDGSITILYTDSSGHQALGFAESIPISLGIVNLKILFGVTFNTGGGMFFGGYAVSLPTLPTIPGFPF